jgi:hypothetical protein
MPSELLNLGILQGLRPPFLGVVAKNGIHRGGIIPPWPAIKVTIPHPLESRGDIINHVDETRLSSIEQHMKQQRLRATKIRRWLATLFKICWPNLVHTVFVFGHVALEILNHLRAKLFSHLFSRDGPRSLRADLGVHSDVHTTQRRGLQ